jgi:proteasome component ECM29
VEGKVQAAIISDIVKLLSSSDFGVVEAAAVALGNLALGNRRLSTDKDLLEGFYSTVKIKQEEVHFTIGEALSCVCGGWASDSAVDQLLATFAGKTRSDEPEPEPNAMAIVLTKLLEGYLLSDRADTRMASSIWLLCLLKNAGKHVAIQKELSRIQYAFSQLLGDQNGSSLQLYHGTERSNYVYIASRNRSRGCLEGYSACI